MSMRQRQYPYNPSVGPVGPAIFLEEFESGTGLYTGAPATSLPVGFGFQNLPVQMHPWRPGVIDPDVFSPGVDTAKQGGFCFSPTPLNDLSYRWNGAIAHIADWPVSLQLSDEPPGELVSAAEIYAKPFMPSHVNLTNLQYAGQQQAGVLVSTADLRGDADGPFIAASIRLRTTELGTAVWEVVAQKFIDHQTLQFEQAIECCGAPHFKILTFTFEEPGNPLTVGIVAYSLDGLTWIGLENFELEGRPQSIGYGCSGYRDDEAPVAYQNGARGGAEYLRILPLPGMPEAPAQIDDDLFEELLEGSFEYGHTEGGRNWP